MRNFFSLIILVSVLSISTVALATTFDYSYQFVSNGNTPGDYITGSFQGTLNSNTGLITGLSNIYCYINGIGLTGNGNLNNSSYNTTLPNQFTDGNAVVSVNGTQNNFFFSNGSGPAPNLNSTNYFYIIPWYNPGSTYATQFYSSPAIPGTVLTQTQVPTNYYGGGVSGNPGYYEYLYNGTYAEANWHVSATPIPAAAWLLGSGLLGLVGIKRRIGKS